MKVNRWWWCRMHNVVIDRVCHRVVMVIGKQKWPDKILLAVSTTTNMRLKVVMSREPRHTDMVTAVGWLNSDEMVSCGDDLQMLKWNLVSVEATTFTTLPAFPTDLHWLPRGGSGSGANTANDLFVLTTTEGMCDNNRRLLLDSRSILSDITHGSHREDSRRCTSRRSIVGEMELWWNEYTYR